MTGKTSTRWGGRGLRAGLALLLCLPAGPLSAVPLAQHAAGEAHPGAVDGQAGVPQGGSVTPASDTPLTELFSSFGGWSVMPLERFDAALQQLLSGLEGAREPVPLSLALGGLVLALWLRRERRQRP